MQSRHLIVIGFALLALAGGLAVDRSTQAASPYPTPAVAGNSSLTSLSPSTIPSGFPTTTRKTVQHSGNLPSLSHARPSSAPARANSAAATASSKPLTSRARFSKAPGGSPSSLVTAIAEPAISIPVTVDPTAPGNLLSSSGQDVRVIAAETHPAGNTLTVEITPSFHSNSPARRGFSIEEDRFRAKWGWQSYGQIQQTAFTASQETN